MNNVKSESVDAIYEIKGNEQLPVKNVQLKNIQVEKVNKFVNKANNVQDLFVDNVTYSELAIPEETPAK